MSKRVRSSEVCADCSGPDPSWASVNRGTFICDECCSVHRSLGRHISQVRHLKHTPWPPTLLQMVETLYNNGANSIWEHSLLDPTSIMSGRRKANPQDKVHPNKAEFIRAKYQMLAFVHRLPCRDDDSVTAKDLSKQLHSSVRTGNLETCLRLLSLGAQANFFHPEKGNTPLHVASKAGQILQAELLAVYGADPGTQDSSGKTPVDYARQGGHHELAERLVEIQYELTDRLAFYLCGRKPDHKNGQHFIIPQMADRRLSLDISELAKAAKKKLQSLSNHLFEELAMDVYDEVDRRETDAVWLATQNHSTLVTETTVVPFLPVNPEYSSTRNQGRQKLARFNAHEFATLVIDILSDAKRRQQGSPLSSSKDNVELILKTISNQHSVESQDNDQPDYDSVASDEDTDPEATASKAHRQKSLDSDLSDGPVTVQEFLEVKNALVASEAKIQQLMKVNNNLSDELRIMQKKLQTLQSENSNLRKQATTNIYQVQTGSEYTDTSNHSSLKRRPSARGSRPMSMYETGSPWTPTMEETVEDPPTSAVLLDHCHFSQVIFNSVEKFYIPGGDITCYYTLTQHFIPRRKDWIGIFRVGWKTTREYYTFMWVTLPVDLNSESAKQQEVQFKAYYLPKDDEYYQFCYVDQDGVVRGASIPFQFRPENEEDILVVTTQGEVEEIEQHNKELCKENRELKDSCVSLQKQNSDMQATLQKKQEELETLKSINKKLEQTMKEQKDCWEIELLQLKEQNQKMSSENEKMGVRVDQLQAQLSNQGKEMEKLVQGVQDKTEQLEHLKEENGQLFLSLTEQREHQKKLEQTVEEMKQRETTAVKKQQELMDQNMDLSKRLSENKMIYNVLQREKEKMEEENDFLKRENSRLLSYMGLDCDSLSYQVPTSNQGGTRQDPGLVFGNPYSGIQESSAPSLLSIKKCPTCKSDFPDDVFDHNLALEQHLQTPSLSCPICDKTFSAKEKQIFEDHVFCHTL